MSAETLDKATSLGNRFYTFEVVSDVTTDGEPIFVASNPELPGCMAQGATEEEAIENLTEARIDYIASLLDDGLDVPEPMLSKTVTAGNGEPVFSEATGTSLEPAHQVTEKAVRTERHPVLSFTYP